MCCQGNDELHIIGLYLGVMRRAATHKLAAFVAFVDDNIPLFRVGHRRHRAQKSAALVGAIPGVFVNVKRGKTKGTVIARAFAKGQNLFFTVFADKSRVVFCKSFRFHKTKITFLLYS